jgi:hypothetical protein
VKHLKENHYRTWMVVIALAALIVSILRLWIGQ